VVDYAQMTPYFLPRSRRPWSQSSSVRWLLDPAGVVRENTEGILLLLEPGPWEWKPVGNDKKLFDEYNRRRAAPLRGAS
jgi:hypothetical protein